MKKDLSTQNFGYLCGILMAIMALLVTALIAYLSWNELSAQMASIFAREGFFNITKGVFAFLGNISSKLKFGRGMTALYYLDFFCVAASILGFVQGALFKNRDLIS